MIRAAASTQTNDAHLERPDAPDPYLELALDTLDIVEFDAFPPAPTGWFPPEEEELLCHVDDVGVVHGIAVAAARVGAQTSQGERADDGLAWLAGTVAPVILVVKAAVMDSQPEFSDRYSRLTLPSTSQ